MNKTTKYALVIPTFENNIGYKLAAIDTYLKELPKNVDIFFVYGGKTDEVNKVYRNGVEFYDVYCNVPDRIEILHKKLFYFFRKFKKQLLEYDYIVKIDDDTFILNVDAFATSKFSGDYIGNKVDVNEKNEEQLRGKLNQLKSYKVREKYTGNFPKSFCSGEFVIYSKKSFNALLSYNGGLKRKNYGLEDVFIGDILTQNDIKITMNKVFNIQHPVTESEFYKLYSTHYEKMVENV